MSETKKDMFMFRFKEFDANNLSDADKALIKEHGTPRQLGRFGKDIWTKEEITELGKKAKAEIKSEPAKKTPVKP